MIVFVDVGVKEGIFSYLVELFIFYVRFIYICILRFFYFVLVCFLW